MARYRLMLEDHADVFPASLEAVQKAVSKLAIPEGPTFLNLTDENGNWAQAGGTEGRYRVEARHVYGEGFQHVMASRLDCRILHPTTVFYRNVCTEGEHPHRRCPLPATVANVLSLDDVLVILTEYWLTGELSAKFGWDDLTSDWLAQAVASADRGIKEIKPKKGKDKDH
jgi:hypothetical protein